METTETMIETQLSALLELMDEAEAQQNLLRAQEIGDEIEDLLNQLNADMIQLRIH